MHYDVSMKQEFSRPPPLNRLKYIKIIQPASNSCFFLLEVHQPSAISTIIIFDVDIFSEYDVLDEY